MDFCLKWQSDFKERKKETTLEEFEKLAREHDTLFKIYNSQVTRTKEAQFHLCKSWEFLQKTNLACQAFSKQAKINPNYIM